MGDLGCRGAERSLWSTPGKYTPCLALPRPARSSNWEQKIRTSVSTRRRLPTQSRAWRICHPEQRLVEAEQLVRGRPRLQGSREISVEYTRKVHPLPCPALPCLIQQTETEGWNFCSHPTTLRHKTGLGPSDTWTSGEPGTQTRYKGKARTYH